MRWVEYMRIERGEENKRFSDLSNQQRIEQSDIVLTL